MYIITSAISGTFGLIFLIAWILLALFTLLNIIRHPELNVYNKVLWIVIILVVPILGSLVYFFWKSSKKPTL